MRETARSNEFLFSRLRAITPTALQGTRPGSRWLLPSTILDGCFHMPAVAPRVGQATGLPVPHSLARVRWDRLPKEGEDCLCRAHLLERNDRHAVYAIELATPDGEVFLEIDRYRAITLAGEGAHVTITDDVAPPSDRTA
jgi:hypothetical protein